VAASGPGGGPPALDYEATRAYTLTVRVTDRGGLTANATVTVTLTNVNEPVTWLPLPRLFARALEVQAVGQALVGYVADPDTAGSGEAFTFSFASPSGNNDSVFALAPRDGQLAVVNPAAPSFAFSPSAPPPVFRLRVVVSDAGHDGPTTTALAEVVIEVSDNNFPPDLPAAPFAVAVPEGSLPGTLLARLYGADRNAAEGQTLTYALSAAGASIGRAFPFNATTERGTGTQGVGTALVWVSPLPPVGSGAGGVVVAAPGTAAAAPLSASALAQTYLDFEAPFKPGGLPNTFTATLTAMDSHATHMTTTALVTITLTDVPEAPYFSASRVPGAGYFAFEIEELSPAGAPLRLLPGASASRGGPKGGIMAIDEDDGFAQSHGALTYTWKAGQPASVTSLFSLHPRTGVVTVAPSAGGALAFRLTPSYILVAVATDITGLTDEARVNCSLIDVNEAPAVAGLLPVSVATGAVGAMQAQALTVPESAPTGAVFGIVGATDNDAGTPAGVLTYALLEDAESLLFGVDPRNGSLFVRYAQLDWEDRVTYRPTLLIRDGGVPSLNVTFTFTVTVLDVVDLRLTAMYLAPGEEAAGAGADIGAAQAAAAAAAAALPARAAASTPATPYLVSHSSMAVLVATPGGTRVRLSGVNVGLTQARLAALGLTIADMAVSATYGLLGTEYTATGCRVTAAYTELECLSAAGIGVDQQWRVNVTVPPSRAPGALPAIATCTRRSGYLPPNITAVQLRPTVAGAAAAAAAAASQAMPTNGSADIVVSGSNLGPPGSALLLTWASTTAGGGGSVYASSRCTSLAAHARIMCGAAPGVGRDLAFRLQVGGSDRQTSPLFSDTPLRYAEPSITRLVVDALDTSGGGIIGVEGANFGPADTPGILLRYSPGLAGWDPASAAAAAGGGEAIGASAGGFPVYTAAKCEADPSRPHTALLCTASPGIGAGHHAVVTVASQPSAASVGTLRYMQPVVLDISGLGTNLAATEGTAQIIITGDQLGPQVPAETLAALPAPVAAYLLPLVRYGALPLPGALQADASLLDTMAALRYAATACQVTVPHKQIICLSAEGVGRDLLLALALGGQASEPFANKTINYHPPILAYYSGPGSALADTAGAQVVLLDGKNYGPIGTPVSNTTYGVTGEELAAWGCEVVIPHTRIRCLTVVGAGAGLSWKVTIAGQRSVAPTTSYAPPEILGFDGPGAADARTDGGDVVRLRGRYFSVQSYLSRVTFGPSGAEYAALGCAVSVNHTEITCLMPPGTGRRLRWMVTVGGQSSAPSVPTTSYEAPLIRSVVPLNGPTSGMTVLAVSGTGFAVRGSPSLRQTRLNALGLTAPPQADRDAYWAATLGGDSPINDVSRWVGALTLLREDAGSATNDAGNHTVFVQLAEGFGRARSLFLVVDGVPSNALNFSYNAPVITNAAPDRLGVPPGYLRVWLEGESFCSGRFGCGAVFVDGVRVTPLNYSHTRAMFVIEDGGDAGAARVATVVVDGVPSNAYYFRKPVPNYLASSQAAWEQLDTTGGQPFFVNGVRDVGTVPSADIAITIGGRRCGAVTKLVYSDTCAQLGIDPAYAAAEQCRTYTLQCATPEGFGRDNSIIIEVPGGKSRDDPDFRLHYAPPTVDRIVDAADPSIVYSYPAAVAAAAAAALGGAGGSSPLDAVPGLPTTGRDVLFIGRNLGAAALYVNRTVPQPAQMLELVNVTATAGFLFHNHTLIRARVPPGIGRNVQARLIIAGQSSTDRALAAPAAPGTAGDARVTAPQAPTFLHFALPAVGAISPTSGLPTTGGVLLTIRGANFGPLPAPSLRNRSLAGPPYNTSGGGARALLQRAPLRLQAGPHDSVHDVSYDGPQNRRLQPQLAAAGSIGAQDGWDAQARSLQSALVEVLPSSGSAPAAGAGGAFADSYGLTYTGYGGGTALPAVFVNGEPCRIPIDYAGLPDHSELVCWAPESEGAGLTVSLVVGDQANTLPAPGQPAVNISYAPPRVTALWPASGPTSGLDERGQRIIMTLTGVNLGRNGSAVVVLQQPAAVSLSLATARGLPTDAASTGGVLLLPDFVVPAGDIVSHNHSAIRFAMPAGAGEGLTVRAVVRGQYSLGPADPDPATGLVPTSAAAAAAAANASAAAVNGSAAALSQQQPQAAAGVGGLLFSYSPPAVRSFRRADREAYECLPRRDTLELRDGTVINRTLPAGCYRTRGGYPLVISGLSFGPPIVRSSVRVTIGGRPCSLETHTHDILVVLAPQGLGDANPLVVTVGSRRSPVTNDTLFAYDPPAVANVQPNTPDALLGEAVSLQGQNFGYEATPLDISVGGDPCQAVSWLGDELLACQVAPGTVGPKNISIAVGNRSDPVVFYEPEQKIVMLCRRGSYGLYGEYCVDCETDSKSVGAVCPGKELYIDLVYSKPGFWRSNVSTPNPDCHPLRQGREKCPLFLACSPLASCLGANTCEYGYEGERCAFCLKGRYYR